MNRSPTYRVVWWGPPDISPIAIKALIRATNHWAAIVMNKNRNMVKTLPLALAAILVCFLVSFQVIAPGVFFWNDNPPPKNIKYGVPLSMKELQDEKGLTFFRSGKGATRLYFQAAGSASAEMVLCGCSYQCPTLPYHWRVPRKSSIKTVIAKGRQVVSVTNLDEEVEYNFSMEKCSK